MQVILNHQQVQQKITRLGHELLENCFEEKSICIGGIHGNGYALAQTIGKIILKTFGSIPFFVSNIVISSEIIGVDPSANNLPSELALCSAFFIGPKSFPLAIKKNKISKTNTG